MKDKYQQKSPYWSLGGIVADMRKPEWVKNIGLNAQFSILPMSPCSHEMDVAEFFQEAVWHEDWINKHVNSLNKTGKV